MSDRQWKPIGAVVGAFALTAPWVYFWATTGAGTFTGGKGPLDTYIQAAVTMGAIIGAAFLLAWGADAAEEDVPQSIAIAGLAVVAVAPEYAIDAYYAYMAGSHAGYGHFAHLAVANFTGANRILIGVGWSLIVLYAIYQSRYGGVDDEAIEHDDGFLTDAVSIGSIISTEYVFLFVATLYGLFVPFLGGLGIVDTVVLVGLYIGYAVVITMRGEDTGGGQVGVGKYIAEQSKWVRRAIVIFFFLFSGAIIVTAVEPFANALEHIGTSLGIPQFLVIQWIAPIASESPEIIVTGYLVNKARSTGAMTALVSSKLNQWTLLVGTLVVVYSLALGHYETFPLTRQQTGEIWLTAAYGFLALSLLVDLRLSVRESLFLIITLLIQIPPWIHEYWRLVGLSLVYVAIGIVIFAHRRQALYEVFGLATRREEPDDTAAVDTLD
jgi:cation:H+ antiporter